MGILHISCYCCISNRVYSAVWLEKARYDHSMTFMASKFWIEARLRNKYNCQSIFANVISCRGWLNPSWFQVQVWFYVHHFQYQNQQLYQLMYFACLTWDGYWSDFESSFHFLCNGHDKYQVWVLWKYISGILNWFQSQLHLFTFLNPIPKVGQSCLKYSNIPLNQICFMFAQLIIMMEIYIP